METSKRLQFKHFFNFIANLMILVVEAVAFGYVWYNKYLPFLPKNQQFYRRGNWAVIGMYILIVFLFTKSMNGYKIGYLRVTDIILAHVLSIILSGFAGYIEVSMIVLNVKHKGYLPIRYIAYASLVEIAFVIVWILAVRKLYKLIYPPRQMLVIYGNYSPTDLISKINSRKDKYKVCEAVSYDVGYRNLYTMVMNYEAVVLADLPAEARNQIMKYCFEKGVRTYVTPKISDILFRGADDIHLFDTPLLLSRNQGLTLGQRFLKRIFDIVVSLAGIVLASPFMLIIAIAIKLYDRGPVLYKQERLTIDNKPFWIYKFRSMKIESEQQGARLAAKDDDRITPVGRIIRNIHFDELPQLFNILKGDMSMVGPRPERREIADKYTEIVPEFPFRLKVKAGLTGYAQVYGKYNTTPYDKLKLDITYIENYSFLLDLKIMFLTFKILFQKENTEGIDSEQTNAIKDNRLEKTETDEN